VAAADLGMDEQRAVKEVKDNLNVDLKLLNEETRYLVFGGLVSAGKTTLVNAMLQHLVPELRKEIKEDKGGRLNLMPTAFNENTRIVTEIELSPSATGIRVQLLERTGIPLPTRMRSGQAGGAEAMDDISAARPQAVQSPRSAPGGTPDETFILQKDLTLPLEKCWRKLQKHIQDICEEEPPEDAMRRLCIQVPCRAVDQTVSIIDTPGLDSPSVWQQLRSLVHAKAFLFIWVGAVDAATAFGLQGRRLVEMYRATGHPLPPCLVLTKWDRLKMLPEFQEEPPMLAEQVKHRLSQFRAGLLPPDQSTIVVKLSQKSEVDQVLLGLALEWSSPSSGDAAQAGAAVAVERWVLTKSVVVRGVTIYKGAVLEAVDNAEVPANPEQFLREQQLPVQLRFRTENAEALLLLAATNAAGAVAAHGSPTRDKAREELQCLWESLIPLLRGLSEPMRISKRLHKIIVATQQVINILLKDDEQAMIFEQNREELESLKTRVLKSFEEKLHQYFAGLPRIVFPPEHVPAGCLPQVSLSSYRPPAGLERSECATCQIPKFILEAHESAQAQKSEFKYVKAVATAAIERWQQTFIDNMMKMQRDCTVELQQQVTEIMQIRGLIDHADWQTNLQSLITSPVESVLSGALAGGVVGVYGGLLAEASMATLIPGIGLGVGLGLGVLVAGAVAAACFNRSELARNIGIWTHEEGQARAAQTVLDVINKKEFQEKAKEMIFGEFQRRLQSCMEQLADLRDPSASNQPEAKAAMNIQLKVAELQRTLSVWFSHFVTDQVSSDPWLVPPPPDLKAAAEGDIARLSSLLGLVADGADGGGVSDGSDSD